MHTNRGVGCCRFLASVVALAAACYDRPVSAQTPASASVVSRGDSPLHLAALRNDAAAVDALLAKEADVAATNAAGATPLHYGVTSERIVAALLARGAPVNARTKLGVSPLVAAAAHGDSHAVVQRLIAAGADVNYVPAGRTTTSSPLSPLVIAVRGGDRRTVELLLEHGAEVNPPAGPLPLTAAALTIDVASARLLLAHGAKPNHRAGTTLSPLAVAAGRRNAEMVALLLEHGADPNVSLTDRRPTPAMVFSGYNDDGDAAMARLFIEHGADVNATDEAGDTALSYALKRGPDTPVARFLRESGARVPAAAPREKSIPTRTVPHDPPARTAMMRDSVQRAIDLLQPSSKVFLATPFVHQVGCTSCHHQSLPAVAFSLARDRGLRVDEPEFGRTLQAIVREVGAKTEHARQMLEPVPASRVTLGYDFDALHALSYAPDEMTDAMSRFLLGWQDRDGSWRATVARGPMEDQIIVATAWSIRAIQLYPPAGRAGDVDRALVRARSWLHAQRPGLANDRVFQLLGLAWANETPERMRPLAAVLITEQRADGGWAQLPTWASDAWATGTVLVALHKAGIAPSHDAYQRGLDFLLRTQFDDGSWWVRSRSRPVQPHFDSQFPHGKDQWISAGGTGWAAIALLLALDPATPDSKKLPDAHALIAKFSERVIEASPPDNTVAATESAHKPPPTAPSSAISFAHDIKPLIERSCAGCHLGEKTRGGLSLASRESLLKGGQSGNPAVVAGHSTESQLVRYVSDQVEDLEMPPLDRREKYPALTAGEISRVRAWIDAGAAWDK